MLNQTSRYALSLLCYLARHGEERIPAHQIAVDTGTPVNYVAKILAVLRRGGVVEGEKGWGGGYALRPRAGDFSVGEVMALFEDKVGPVVCPFLQPECGCHLARHSEERVSVSRPAREVAAAAGCAVEFAVGGSRVGETAGRSGDGARAALCPYGAVECMVSSPCPLHRHWATIREGFWGLAETRLGELVGGAVG
jgi:Rrf2 family protein